jgi:hypothetical protein
VLGLKDERFTRGRVGGHVSTALIEPDTTPSLTHSAHHRADPLPFATAGIG